MSLKRAGGMEEEEMSKKFKINVSSKTKNHQNDKI